MGIWIAAGVTASALWLAQAADAQYSFQGLGVLPGDMSSGAHGVSGDGLVIAGYSNPPDQFAYPRAFRWMAQTGMIEILSDAEARAASSDGSVIVGGDYLGHAFRWTQATGAVELERPREWISADALDVSDDGSKIAGFANTPSGFRAFRWVESAGMTDLGKLPNATFSFGNGISGDGTSVVGRSGTNSAWTAFRWTEATGMKSLGTLPGKTKSEAWAASGDGSVIVGESGGRAMRWTEAGGMEDLGFSDIAYAVTPDGTTIVGGIPAFYWTKETGRVDLVQLLTSHGIDMTGWSSMEARGCSADGRTIVGRGMKSDKMQAWVITVPGLCYADCDGNGDLDIDDFICYQTKFAFAHPYADCDNSKDLDIDDFICFQTQFAVGCP